MTESLIPEEIREFLDGETQEAWCRLATENLDVLLVDHAQCEHKAAATAMHLIYRYPEHADLVYRMSRLAREELRHFEQVMKLLQARGYSYRHQAAARYAAGLRAKVRKKDPGRLIDLLIIGAFIEARSCERFACLAPWLDEELAAFYRGLLASESRHFRHYLRLAEKLAGEDISDRVLMFREIEGRLIREPDPQFRFHSGLPAADNSAALN